MRGKGLSLAVPYTRAGTIGTEKGEDWRQGTRDRRKLLSRVLLKGDG